MITSVVITNSGSGYMSAPQVTLSRKSIITPVFCELYQSESVRYQNDAQSSNISIVTVDYEPSTMVVLDLEPAAEIKEPKVVGRAIDFEDSL